MPEKSNYRIETADTKEKYEGLRTLWCEVFNDEEEFVDTMYTSFGADPAENSYTSDSIKGYVIEIDGRTVSALTCFRCGDFEGRPAYTSYAICTDPAFRGEGLAGALVDYARDKVSRMGGVSIISPAEPSLELFYGAHGYETFFFASTCETAEDDEDFVFDEEDAEYDKADPGFEMKSLSADDYSSLREEFLAGRPHVSLSRNMMRLIHLESKLPDGKDGLCLINGGDALCAISGNEDGSAEIAELLVNPKLEELSSEIAGEIVKKLEKEMSVRVRRYTIPGGTECQSMIAGLDGEYYNGEAYYGFPID